jgi:N6-L-threonylcarbamoyladenine synthase
MEILGETLDDAVGEAFDKAAKLLGFTYPGGSLIDKYAKTGDPFKFKFPKTSVRGFDFSFSGIKTAFLYFLKREIGKEPKFIDNNIHDICASIQYTLIQMLLDILIAVSHKTRVKNIAIAGGVASNSYLRSQLAIISETERWNIYIPKLEYCTDNAAMVAMAAHFKYLENRFADLKASAYPRLKY